MKFVIYFCALLYAIYRYFTKYKMLKFVRSVKLLESREISIISYRHFLPRRCVGASRHRPCRGPHMCVIVMEEVDILALALGNFPSSSKSEIVCWVQSPALDISSNSLFTWKRQKNNQNVWQ